MQNTGIRDRISAVFDRSAPPVLAARLLPNPGFQGEGERLETLNPRPPPIGADDGGVRRGREDRRQRRAPLDRIGDQAPAFVMDVVLIAIIGGADAITALSAAGASTLA